MGFWSEMRVCPALKFVSFCHLRPYSSHKFYYYSDFFFYPWLEKKSLGKFAVFSIYSPTALHHWLLNSKQTGRGIILHTVFNIYFSSLCSSRATLLGLVIRVLGAATGATKLSTSPKHSMFSFQLASGVLLKEQGLFPLPPS